LSNPARFIFVWQQVFRSAADRKEYLMIKVIGILLIVFGLVGVAWGGFTYTTRQKVVDIGPIHASRDETHSVPLPPIAGALAIVGGIALVASGRNG
jgi:hypothetical protein